MNEDSTSDEKLELSQKAMRKEREREGHRLAILKAAEVVFGRNGFHGATIEEIARESGYAVGTLYNFFKNKEDLYTHVIVSHHEDLTRRFDEALASGQGTVDTLGLLLDLLLTHFTEHQSFVRIFFQSSEGPLMNSLPSEIRRFHTHYSQSLLDLFQRGTRSGEIVKLDPQLLAFCFEGFISAIVRCWALGDFKEPLSTLSQNARQTFRTILRTQGA